MSDTNDSTSLENNECFLTEEQIANSYNLSLHIASVFVLLAVSFIGASISVLSSRVKLLQIHPIIINTGKFFGSGVVLATGFIHILPDAMSTLSDPCLPNSWNEYGAYGGLFAMLAALGMQLIEFLANQRYHSLKRKHIHLKTIETNCGVDDISKNKTQIPIEKEQTKSEPSNAKNEKEENAHQHHHHHDDHQHHHHHDDHQHHHHHDDHQHHQHHHHHDDHQHHHHNHQHDHTHTHVYLEQTSNELDGLDKVGQIIEKATKKKKKVRVNGSVHNSENPIQVNDKIEETNQIKQPNDVISKAENRKSISRKSQDLTETFHRIEVLERKDENNVVEIDISHFEMTSAPGELCEPSGHHHGAAFHDDGQQHKISTYLLEFGIALHSVLIGLTLGTTTESFTALFIALSLHQFFEAIALGAQIAHLKTTSLRSSILMVVFFSLTTPVGIAIGIGIHSGTYNPKSVSSLLVTGILDSLSAGILIYVALVNLITAEMGINAHGFYSLSTRLKLLYFAALYLGAAAMAIIGRWA